MSTPQEILEAVSNLTVMELSLLTREMEEKFGVSGEQKFTVVDAQPIVVDTAPAKTEFDVVILEIGTSKVAVIKAVREITANALGLIEAKTLVEAGNVPVLTGVDQKRADAAVAILQMAGAKAEAR